MGRIDNAPQRRVGKAELIRSADIIDKHGYPMEQWAYKLSSKLHRVQPNHVYTSRWGALCALRAVAKRLNIRMRYIEEVTE